MNAMARDGFFVDVQPELAVDFPTVRALAERARAEVHPAPRLGVPDVTALGPVPSDPDGLTTFLGRLDRVERALTQAHGEYAAALARRDGLAERAGWRQLPAPGLFGSDESRRASSRTSAR